MRYGSLFSGGGGLDLAVGAVFGASPAWHCELNPSAAKVLAHRFPGVPNLGDITAVNWSAVEPVDVLCGGFPCQDISAAGRQAGMGAGTRSGLWSEFARAIGELRPPLVIIENVRNLLSVKANRAMESGQDAVGDGGGDAVLRGLGAVLGDLADIGYDAQWATVSAASIGAPHRRERVFIIAADADSATGWQRGGLGEAATTSGCGEGEARQDLRSDTRGSHRDAPDAAGNGRHEGRPEPTRLGWRPDAPIGGAAADVALLPTPKVAAQRVSRKALTQQHWSAPGLEQALEIARGELPRELKSWDELQGNSGAVLPTPAARDWRGHGPGQMDRHSPNMSAIADLLPTPCAHQSGNTPENHLRKKPGRKVVTDLAILVENGLMPTGGALLPTPGASDGSGGRAPSESGGTRASGAKRSVPLTDLPLLLPTPGASDTRGQDYARADRERSGGDDLVTAAVKAANANLWGKYAPAIEQWEAVTRPAPSPTEPNRNGKPRLNPAFSEWMMGWPDGWVTQVPGVSRNDQLRIVGNGVCPQQCAAALRFLLSLGVCGVSA